MVLQMVGMDEAFCHLGGTRLGVATLALFKWSSVGVIPYLDFCVGPAWYLKGVLAGVALRRCR